ncbi:MAG: cache domain-containing protein [Thermodesulfobacteriota bacterium]
MLSFWKLGIIKKQKIHISKRVISYAPLLIIFGIYLELIKTSSPFFCQRNGVLIQERLYLGVKKWLLVTQYMEIKGRANNKNRERRRKSPYSILYRRFIFITLICSLVPLLMIGWGINVYYSRFSMLRMMGSFQTQVDNHKRIIELFLKERSSDLQLIVHTHSLNYLQKEANLIHIFHIMNRDHGSFTDLGVIDERGRQLAYIGPYDLIDKNYSETFWFKEVMEKGVYISDMFMGFRKIPHFIIAVTCTENGKKWILRTTIDTETFRSLIENVNIGKTGEVYLLNRGGFFQTSPRFSGKIMEKAPFPIEPFHEDTKIRIVESNARNSKQRLSRHILAQAWLNEPQWMLVVTQEYSEAFNDIKHVSHIALIFLHLSALSVLLISIAATRYMIKAIKKRHGEGDGLIRNL